MQDLIIENQTLTTKLDDKRDREVIRQLRRDLDDYKRRSNDLLSETSELRKERDQVKVEKNDMMISHARELEDERNAKRVNLTEIDKL